jgi:hypothetical protein
VARLLLAVCLTATTQLPMPRLLVTLPPATVAAVAAVAAVRSGSGHSMLVFVVISCSLLLWQCADDLTFWYSVRLSYVMLSWLELWPKEPLLACVSVSSAVAGLILMDPTMNAKHLHRAASWC